MNVLIGKPYRFLVIEVLDREVYGIHFCHTRSDAVKTANRLLETRLGECGIDVTTKDGQEEAKRCEELDEVRYASKTVDNAWCNLRDGDWDAFIQDLSKLDHKGVTAHG